jgi:uncharacterized protein (DUF58 family)
MSLHALKTLQLKAKDQVYTLLAGQHLSKLQGEGYDFSLLREYQMGDDVRKIHWLHTAKMGKPYIKEFHSNRELSVTVCALMDGGLYFGKDNAKQKKLSEVSMLLGYLVEHNADLFTGIAYTQDQTLQTPPTKQRYLIESFNQSLFEAPLMHTSLNYPLVIQDLFGRLSKPSLLFVLGDFMEETDLSLLAQRHEVIAIIIRDEKEESPKVLGETLLKNPQNTHALESYFGKKSIKHYLESFHAHEAKRKAHFERYGIHTIKILCEDNIVEKLLKGLA